MNFDQKAEIYEKISISQQQAAIKLLSMMKIEPQHQVLDVGCGSGYLTELMSNLSSSVSGFDIAEKMIIEAQKLRPTINFFIADADAFCNYEAYDWIVTNAVTYYFKNLPNTLSNFYLSLKPNGCYALQAQTEVTPQFLQAMSGLWNDPVTAQLYSKFQLPINQLKFDEFIQVLTSAGFVIEDAQMVNFKTEYSFNQALDIFKSGTATPFLNPYGYGTVSLPQEYIVKFWQIVEDGLKQQCKGDKITLDVPRCFIIAKKMK
ncbi:MAG: methyltransferase domain-containing protein [Burkholderiales bacterium]|nr:methyltransferase domain-containing protein [Burkholderiales bacterium]